MMNDEYRSHRCVFFVFLVLFALSCISPPYPRYFILQHVPTAASVVALVVLRRRLRISLLSYSLLLLFLVFHLLGARYLYSYVPYDSWTESLLGINLTRYFGFTRNHYDRLVHFIYGLLIAVPAYRFQLRFLKLRPRWAALLAIQFIMATSALYELLEWLVALTLAADWANEYNGQQGDFWDPQKDMALAAFGAVLSMCLAALVSTRRKAKHLRPHRRP